MAQRVSQPAARALLALGGSSLIIIGDAGSRYDGGRPFSPGSTGRALVARVVSSQVMSYGGETIGTIARQTGHSLPLIGKYLLVRQVN